MKEIKDLKKDAIQEIGQAAAEYKYLQKLHDELILLKSDLGTNPKRSEKDVREAISIVRGSLGRTERYLSKVDLKKDIAELMGYLPQKLKAQLADMDKLIEIALNFFIQKASRYTGALKQGLDDLEKEVDQAAEAKDARVKSSSLIRARQHVDAILGEVNKTIEFIGGFEVELGKYQKFLDYLEDL
ncbi:hypothetical protein J4417_02985 [Candidatus Woesearchaeota archaeon]|nr:hypothetical protein [Candidatus Woesearchaeota archaeon]